MMAKLYKKIFFGEILTKSEKWFISSFKLQIIKSSIMNRYELLERINEKGKSLGYPLFVMKGGQILKTPPKDVPFELVVFDEIDVHKSLNNQKLMSYAQWLSKTMPTHSMPRSFHQWKFEEKYHISHLKPKTYNVTNAKIYVYAEPDILYLAKVVKESSVLAEVLELPRGYDGFYIIFAPWQDVKVEEYSVSEQDKKETYYYLH